MSTVISKSPEILAKPSKGGPEETTALTPRSAARSHTVYPAVEYEGVEIPLTELITKSGELDIYPQVRGDFFNIYTSKGKLVFQAGGYYGLIPVNDRVALDVKTRVPVRNFERMLRIAEHDPRVLSPHKRKYEHHEESIPSLIDLLAQALIDSVGEIEIQGLHREYFRRTEDTSFPRGRVLINETMRRHESRGIRHHVTASWFEPSTDTAPNRCLKYAIWYLAQIYRRIKPFRTGVRRKLIELNRIYHIFHGAELDLSRSFLKNNLISDPAKLPSIRAYYRPALNIALTIIKNQGVAFETRDGEIPLETLVIDLKKAFESYLRAVLRSGLQEVTSDVLVLDGNKKGSGGGAKLLFDSAPSELATPDIVIQDTKPAAGEPDFPVILDVKYKKVKKPERSDIEQVISYGASYRSPCLVIAHPRYGGTVHGLRALGEIDPMTLYQYVFDLAAEDPEAEENKFAKSMLSLIVPSGK